MRRAVAYFCGLVLPSRRRPERGSLCWAVLRAYVFGRDDFRCTKCGARPAYGQRNWLECHHIRPIAQNRGCWWLHTPANLTTLCKTCHDWVHEYEEQITQPRTYVGALLRGWVTGRRYGWRREDRGQAQAGQC